MKKYLLILMICFTSTQVMAQTQTLISGDIKHGGYGGPVLKVTQINGDTGLMVGGRGGWIINDTFCLGAGGYGLATIHEVPDAAKAVYTKQIIVNDAIEEVPRDLELALGYGGLTLEYIANRRTRNGDGPILFGPLAVTTELPVLSPPEIRSRVRRSIPQPLSFTVSAA